MSILRMDTEQTQNLVANIRQTTESIETELGVMRNHMNAMPGYWQGPASQQYGELLANLAAQMETAKENGLTLGQRLSAEIAQWQETAAQLDGGAVAGGGSGGVLAKLAAATGPSAGYGLSSGRQSPDYGDEILNDSNGIQNDSDASSSARLLEPSGVVNPSARLEFERGKLSEAKVELFEGSVFKQEYFDGHAQMQEFGGEAGLGIHQTSKGNVIGAYAEAYVFNSNVEGTLLGDKNLGWTAGAEASALSAEGYAGYRDGSIGAEIGGTLASVKATTGMNIAGYNVGVDGEVGLMLKAGASIGKHSRFMVGPIAVGFNFDVAQD